MPVSALARSGRIHRRKLTSDIEFRADVGPERPRGLLLTLTGSLFRGKVCCEAHCEEVAAATVDWQAPQHPTNYISRESCEPYFVPL